MDYYKFLVYVKMSDKTTYYQKKKKKKGGIILNRAKQYYENKKESLRASKKKKQIIIWKRKGYRRNRLKNMSEDIKQRLKVPKNYHRAKK